MMYANEKHKYFANSGFWFIVYSTYAEISSRGPNKKRDNRI